MQLDRERGGDLHGLSNGIGLAVASNSLLLRGEADVPQHSGAVGEPLRRVFVLIAAVVGSRYALRRTHLEPLSDPPDRALSNLGRSQANRVGREFLSSRQEICRPRAIVSAFSSRCCSIWLLRSPSNLAPGTGREG